MSTTSKIDPSTLCRSLESALRAGYSVRQALGRISEDFDHPSLTAAADAAASGAPIVGLLDDWARVDPDVALIAAAIKAQVEDGGNLADRLGALSRLFELRP